MTRHNICEKLPLYFVKGGIYFMYQYVCVSHQKFFLSKVVYIICCNFITYAERPIKQNLNA